MKLVRYVDPASGLTLHLHPQVNVIRGLSSEARTRLLRNLAAIPKGGPLTASGTIAVHGVTLDLSVDTLELLELDEPVDVVVHRWDVPGGEDDQPDGPDTEREAELGAALAAEQDASREAEAAAGRLEEAAGRLSETRTRHGELGAQVEAARAGMDDGAAVELRSAKEALDRLKERRSQEAADRRAAERRQVEERLDHLGGELADVERRLRPPQDDPAETIREAVAELDAVSDPTPVHPPEARELASELASAAEHLAAVQDRLAGGRSQLMELTARRDAAYDAFVTAEQWLRTPDLDPAKVAELERIHEEIFDMDARVSRLSAARLRRRASALRLREQALLAELGFDTWSSYVTGVASPEAEAERQRRYEVAKATYEFAEDELARAAAQPSHDSPELRNAERRVSDLREQAARLLGRSPGPDPVTELREHTVPAGSLRGSITAAAAALRLALADGGVSLPSDCDVTTLRDAADDWLGRQAEREQELGRLEVRRRELREAVDAAEAELDRLAALPETVDLDPSDPEAAELTGRIHAASVRVDAHRAALERFERLREELAEVGSTLARLTDEVAEAEREASRCASLLEQASVERHATHERWEAITAEREAARRSRREAAAETLDVDAVEWYLLARLAAQRSVSYVGSLPIVIDDAFSGWGTDRLAAVYHRLARMSDVVQVVICSDDPEVAQWAAGLDGASSVIEVSAN